MGGGELSDNELNAWIDKILRKGGGDPLCILKDGAIIAFLLLYCNKYDTLEAYICNVYVLEQYRGNGLSRILVDRAIEICKQREFISIYLDVACDNMPAIKTYLRCGFRMTEQYDKEGEAFYKMSLNLI